LRTAEKSMIKIINGERFTPFSLAKKLNAKVLLESASFVRGRERYSIMLIKEAFSIFEADDGIIFKKDNKKFRLKSKGKDILDTLLYFASQHEEYKEMLSKTYAGTDNIPFPAGGIGYLTYEYCANFDTIIIDKNKPDTLNTPDAFFLFGHIFLIFDHYTDSIILLGLNYKEHEIDLDKEIKTVEDRINDLNFNFMSPQKNQYKAENITGDKDKESYLKGVEKVKEEIIKGNLLQGVISRRVYLKTDMPSLEAYKHLRSFNPSPYMFFLDFEDFQLFGSSPEVHVKVKGSKVIIRPIAGTRKRGKTEAEDNALEKDLLSDEKELAEHLMLVDLARNDIGRICVPGSIHVTEKMVIEKYSHVIHVVSQVEGKLSNDKQGIDAIRATFPAGTVSGAPKIKAIETIDSLEKEKRGFYAGIIGYIEPDGSLDTCITIRSAFQRGNDLILQAGAGIVYDSVPEKEYEETSAKLRALGTALGVEV